MQFKPAQWSSEASAGIAAAAGDDLQEIAMQVYAGTAKLYRCFHAGEFYGWLVTRADSLEEFVVVCYEGRDVRLLGDTLVPLVFSRGFRSIRFYTQRPALLRMLQKWNPQPLEYIVRIENHGGTESSGGIPTQSAQESAGTTRGQ